MQFSHLHVHTQFSLLDGAAPIKSLFEKARKSNMPGLAITDHGNMFGVFKFVNEAYERENLDSSGHPIVKPIIGCEFYLVDDRHKKQFTKDNKDIRYHQLLLAKNSTGYKNLSKLCSLGFLEGMYGKWPRIDKELILTYHEGLIATTCCLGASVPKTILKKGEEAGEQEFLWWLNIFQEDYYIEIQRHHMKEQDEINPILLKWAKKYNVKVICTNDSHYVEKEDYNLHDILLCVNTGDLQSTPIATEEESGKGTRFGFYNDEFYFKTTTEMESLFKDIPFALDNTNEIVDKVDYIKLKRDIMVPMFPLPAGFKNMDEYLRHLTWEGAKIRYQHITQEIEERVTFELNTINNLGFSGYFLIVRDFILAGKELGVSIGPGRGSAAGSAVAYCIGITNVDPLKYGMLFERFLNPDRKSMPDIDTDFDDEGREKVMQYVINKYGKNNVAQIINYGTMKSKSAIKDVARVLNLPLNDANDLTRIFPNSITKIFKDNDDVLTKLYNLPEEELKTYDMPSEEIENAKKLKNFAHGNDLRGEVLRQAAHIEGAIRNTGIHASAIIISPENLMDVLPLTINTKDENGLFVTQWDGSVIEKAGLLKMDFLGLKTLTIIKNAVQLIEKNHGIKINPDLIPLDDLKTFEIFQNGETNGIFQFEKVSVQKALKELKPTRIEDLIAMNALNRPGPMEYIPSFIRRKNGLESIHYDLPECEEILQETFGITVYQEQVMLLSQKLAGFSKGQADNLRKAIGKKNAAELANMRDAFFIGCAERNHPESIVQKIWNDWEKFAEYAFNKSHSTCYSIVSFQTAYLKAHYPSEFMAATLNNYSGDIENISFFMEECKRMNIEVLGPDINESSVKFSVNPSGNIRFGLGMIKGVGELAVGYIIDERNSAGPFKSIYDLAKRVNPRFINKRILEGLTYSGAFDSFEDNNRARYFFIAPADSENTLEKAIRFGNNYQSNAASKQVSLFGGESSSSLPEPRLPEAEAWGKIEQLSKEKEFIGMFLSGHPLDKYKFQLEVFCKNKLSEMSQVDSLVGKEITVGGMITIAEHKTAKTGNKFGVFTLEDFSGKYEFNLFSRDYIEFNKYLVPGLFIYVRALVTKAPDKEFIRVNIKEILEIASMQESHLKEFQISIMVNSTSSETYTMLTGLLQDNKGKTPLKIILKHPDYGYKIETIPSKSGINLHEDLYIKLKEMELNPTVITVQKNQ